MRLIELICIVLTPLERRHVLLRPLPAKDRVHSASNMLELTREIQGITLGEWIRYQENK